MPKRTVKHWQAWNNERERFKKRDTIGFVEDIQALEKHILKLQEVCPKDAAGWPDYPAVNVIEELGKVLEKAKRYLSQLR